MEYDIKSKPTRYNGRNYRSRLEAQWAAFFDLTGWEFQYEPSEINGYNPDFIIKCKSKMYPTKYIIVEVKPSVFIDEEYKESVYDKYCKTNAHILILSDMPFYKSDDYDDLVTLGFGSQFFEEPYKRSSWLEMHMKSLNDFGSNEVMWDGMISGKIDRKEFLRFEQRENMPTIISLYNNWYECANKVQFKVK